MLGKKKSFTINGINEKEYAELLWQIMTVVRSVRGADNSMNGLMGILGIGNQNPGFYCIMDSVFELARKTLSEEGRQLFKNIENFKTELVRRKISKKLAKRVDVLREGYENHTHTKIDSETFEITFYNKDENAKTN